MPSGVYTRTKENRANVAAATKQMWEDPEYRAKQEQSCPMSERARGHTVNPKSGENLAQWIKDNPEQHRKYSSLGFYASLNSKGPNRGEQYLLKVLKSLSPNWQFVGTGQLMLGKKNPDFWNGDNQLVELFGDNFHEKGSEDSRIEYFKSYGYQCLIIWTSELSNRARMLAKIQDWLKKGGT